MTYAKNYSIDALDINSMSGTINALAPYASSVAATQKVAALWGVGYGDRGYGQTTPALNPKATGDVIRASDFLDVRTALANMLTYQGSSLALVPPVSEFTVGGSIKAEVPATTPYDFPTSILNADNNRLLSSDANKSITSASLTVTRAATWGTPATTTITAEITATFPSENAARFFFNSGGTLNIVMAHPSTLRTQDVDWRNILLALGTISIGARSTKRSGTGGTPSTAIGYYNLTAAYQTVFNGTNIGSGAYSANDVTINAMVQNVAGVNGANGTVVKIQVLLADQHANAFSDVVQGGTNAAFGFTKAAAILAGIASPSFAVATNF